MEQFLPALHYFVLIRLKSENVSPDNSASVCNEGKNQTTRAAPMIRKLIPSILSCFGPDEICLPNDPAAGRYPIDRLRGSDPRRLSSVLKRLFCIGFAFSADSMLVIS